MLVYRFYKLFLINLNFRISFLVNLIFISINRKIYKDIIYIEFKKAYNTL